MIPLLLCAAAALRRNFWDRRSWALSAAALVTLLLSFGFLLPLYRLLFAIAPLRRLRYPIKFYLITSLCVALLAGLAGGRVGPPPRRMARGNRSGGGALRVRVQPGSSRRRAD